MALQIKYCLAVIFLVSFTTTAKSEETDFKTRFGEEFGNALKQYNAEVEQAILDNFVVMYNTFLRDLNCTEELERGFKMRILRVKSLKDRIGNSVTAETLRTFKSTVGLLLFEIVSLTKTKFMKEEPARLTVVTDALKAANEKEMAGTKVFKEKLQTKWRSMFKTIPAEELQNHVEYNEINDLMEKSTDDYLASVENIAIIWRKVTEFFNYEEYKFIFDKKKI